VPIFILEKGIGALVPEAPSTAKQPLRGVKVGAARVFLTLALRSKLEVSTFGMPEIRVFGFSRSFYKNCLTDFF